VTGCTDWQGEKPGILTLKGQEIRTQWKNLFNLLPYRVRPIVQNFFKAKILQKLVSKKIQKIHVLHGIV
jgi:hypothetical protein